VCRFNDLSGIDKIAKVQAQVAGVAGIMQDNIRLVLERGDRVNELQERTQQLNEQVCGGELSLHFSLSLSLYLLLPLPPALTHTYTAHHRVQLGLNSFV
jgi:hypothetical protein